MLDVTRIFDDAEELRAELPPGHVVSATFIPDEDGEFEFEVKGVMERFRAAYFAAPEGADADWMRKMAFEIRNGRPMEQYQEWVIEEAKQSA